MARYIDADKLTYSRVRIIHSDGTMGGWNAVVMSSVINNAPAANVVEVRHGEWIESTHWGEWYYDCPFCDDGFATRRRHETLPNFCSNCGAKLTGVKMDGERKEQT